MRVAVILLGLLIALALPELPIQGFVAPATTLSGHLEREAFFWIVTAILVAYVLFAERRPLASIGLVRPSWKSFVFGVLAGIVLVAGFVAIFTVVMPALHIPPNTGAMAGLMHTPLWFRVLLVLRAAVFEEICYRGYTIERVQELSGSRVLAFVASVAAFTLAMPDIGAGARFWCRPSAASSSRASIYGGAISSAT